jgi:hypothetical protein
MRISRAYGNSKVAENPSRKPSYGERRSGLPVCIAICIEYGPRVAED